MSRCHRRVVMSAVVMVALLAMGCGRTGQTQHPTPQQLEEIRQVERERLRALVSDDFVTARALHTDDFQLINPAGIPVTKAEYLAQLESGQLDYRAWESGDIDVRLYGDVAVLRYRDSRFEVALQGRLVHSGPMYHTNLYERHDGRWQIVWSQASGQLAPPRE